MTVRTVKFKSGNETLTCEFTNAEALGDIYAMNITFYHGKKPVLTLMSVPTPCWDNLIADKNQQICDLTKVHHKVKSYTPSS